MTIDDAFASLSREVRLCCDANGTITFADEPAQRLLGAAPGVTLTRLCLEGVEAKASSLVELACSRGVSGWELVLLVEGKPKTLAFSGAPHEGGAALVGSLVPDDYASSLSELSSALNELATLHRELIARGDELRRVNRRLDESERGVRVLNQELVEKSESFLGVMNRHERVIATIGHELRSPVSSIVGLARLLLSGADGPLTPEQERQVGFVLRSAESLGALLGDLLELSKLDAGRSGLRLSRFKASDLFATLRGMTRPLHDNPSVALVFDEPPAGVELETDEVKLSQVLRNFVSNALKFTSRGEVRVSLELTDFGAARFVVRDSGVGISREDVGRLFREFSQIDNPSQPTAKGAGLGLAISRRLASILSGEITVQSEPGKGSTFVLVVPLVHPESVEMRLLEERAKRATPAGPTVLAVEDDRAQLLLYERLLSAAGLHLLPARTIEQARAWLARGRPDAIIADLMLEDATTWRFLAELKADPATRDVPVVVATVAGAEERARAIGVDDFALKPLDERWLVRRVSALVKRGPLRRVLLVDDDEPTRYLMRKYLEGTPFVLTDATTAADCVRLARDEQPHLIVLDYYLPDGTAPEVLAQLSLDARSASVPVLVLSAQPLPPREVESLERRGVVVVDKRSLTRDTAAAKLSEVLSRHAPEARRVPGPPGGASDP